MDKTKPLIMIMESARTEASSSMNEIQRKYGLPAYLMEGILTGILSQVRDAKAQEMCFAETNGGEGDTNGDTDEANNEHQPRDDG